MSGDYAYLSRLNCFAISACYGRKADVRTRLATNADLPTLHTLIPESVRALSTSFYSEAVIESAIRYIFGVDTTLIADGTYFVAESESVICGCGGWSKRRTLFGGDRHKSVDDPLLDPHTDAARIRAFFVAPAFARRGIGALLMQTCATAAFNAGFRQLELMATLPGVPLYLACGFRATEHVEHLLPNGVRIPFVRMHRTLVSPA